jgi:hypothetical protein
MGKAKCPPDDIRDFFNYDPASGSFYSKVTGKYTKPSHSEGYHRVQFRGIRYYVHRLSYWWLTNEWPEEVDHIDINPSNNKFKNLRPATPQQNSCNKSTYGSSRYRGVCWYKRNQKWGVSLRPNGVFHYLGLFESELEAGLAYNYKAQELAGEFARFNQVFEDVPQELLDVEV